MRLQRLTDYLLRHRWQAVLLTFLITYIPVIGLGSILIAGLVTLCAGIFEGAVFTIAATLPYVLVFFSNSSQEAVPLIIWATVILSISGNLLTWIFAVMLRRNCSWSQILQIAALLGVLFISVLHLIFPDIANWWGSELQFFYKQPLALTGFIQSDQPIALGESQLDTINIIKHFATGIVVAFVLLSAVTQVIVARWWQSVVFNPGMLRKGLHNIHLSKLAGVLFLVSLVFYYLENSVVLDILPVLFLLFGAAGLSLVHYLCGLMSPAKGKFWLSILYIALMYSLTMFAMLPLMSALNLMLPVVSAVLILSCSIFVFVSLGLIDIWSDVRKRTKQI